MARKKQKENIVINPTELVPTTIGKINNKESGPFFVIALILLFLVGIFFLDKITDFLNNRTVDVPSTPVTERPNNPNEPEEPSSDEENNIHPISEKTFLVNGFEVSNIEIADSLIQFKMTRKEGEKDLFLKQNYYLELYNQQNTFLGRIKMENVSINNSRNFSLDLSSINNNTIFAISIVPKTENDYPLIEVEETGNNEYTLVCSKDDTNLSYIFSKAKDIYALQEIEEEKTILDTESDYDSLLDEYTLLVESLEDANGIKAFLTPLSIGFRYTLNANLSNLDENTIHKYLKESVYYEKDTEAKVVAFELEASGYSCK